MVLALVRASSHHRAEKSMAQGNMAGMLILLPVAKAIMPWWGPPPKFQPSPQSPTAKYHYQRNWVITFPTCEIWGTNLNHSISLLTPDLPSSLIPRVCTRLRVQSCLHPVSQESYLISVAFIAFNRFIEVEMTHNKPCSFTFDIHIVL